MKTNDCHLFENYTHYTNTAVINIGIQIKSHEENF